MLHVVCTAQQEDGVDETIALLDEYGLSKMDMTES